MITMIGLSELEICLSQQSLFCFFCEVFDPVCVWILLCEFHDHECICSCTGGLAECPIALLN